MTDFLSKQERDKIRDYVNKFGTLPLQKDLIIGLLNQVNVLEGQIIESAFCEGYNRGWDDSHGGWKALPMDAWIKSKVKAVLGNQNEH